ncbi:Hypothetical predicted protein [Paramuricea clavata]|uniref:Integrase zinc-binding domain-containing protein n=1 Tax=Paramuricea clavata TaxID=317549 RepID=A0A6S7HCR0_PARCT|nr:Hypothetical predicted protein [Paramuricea clavata]
MAAFLASRLAKTVYDKFKIKSSEVILWSDSMIVLAWLHSQSTSLQLFVGVRVVEIQATWESDTWRYVPTDLNPADDLSRGIPVTTINKCWMNSPSFLKGGSEMWPSESNEIPPNVPEIKVTKPMFTWRRPSTNTIVDPSRFSNWRKLCRVTAYCFRFVNNVKASKRVHGVLLPEEIESAERYWILSAQEQLGDWKERYKELAPFEKEVIRVGGRLKHSPLSYDNNHPVLLPTEHHISKLVIKDAHNLVRHAGCERTLCETRRKFWIPSGRNLVQKIVRECVTCRKLHQYPYKTLMADLPPERLKVFSPPSQ